MGVKNKVVSNSPQVYPSLLFLIGFMGSGKTTLGKILANKLDYNFVDTDAFIEKSTDHSINDLWSTYGEKHFRGMETQVLKEIISYNNTVVSCGGGLPCVNNNLELMLDAGVTIYLKTSAEVLNDRLINEKSTRPLIKDKGADLQAYINKELEKRSVFYNRAQIIFDNDQSPELSLNLLLNALK